MSSDANVFTTIEVLAWFDPCCRCDHSRLLATTRALESERARAEFFVRAHEFASGRAEKAEKERDDARDEVTRRDDLITLTADKLLEWVRENEPEWLEEKS